MSVQVGTPMVRPRARVNVDKRHGDAGRPLRPVLGCGSAVNGPVWVGLS